MRTRREESTIYDRKENRMTKPERHFELGKTFLYAMLAGLVIALGGTVFLSVENKVLGSVFFAVGLFTICTFGFFLFTGKVCYIFEQNRKYALNLLPIWLGNLAGTWMAARLLLFTRVAPALRDRAASLCETKLADAPFSIFLLAVFCNILIFIAVDGFQKNPHELGKYLGLFFGVTVFILCGFEHCVANMFYFSLAGAWSAKTFGYLLIMTLGNSIGGFLIPVIRSLCTKFGSQN